MDKQVQVKHSPCLVMVLGSIEVYSLVYLRKFLRIWIIQEGM